LKHRKQDERAQALSIRKQKEKKNMYIIYNDFFRGWCITPEANYRSRVKNACAILKLEDCEGADEAISCALACGFKYEQLIVDCKDFELHWNKGAKAFVYIGKGE